MHFTSGRIHSAVFWLHPTFPSQSVMTGSKYPLPHPTRSNQRPFHLLSFPRSESQVTVYPSHPFAHTQIFKCFPRTGPGVRLGVSCGRASAVLCQRNLPPGWVGGQQRADASTCASRMCCERKTRSVSRAPRGVLSQPGEPGTVSMGRGELKGE